MLIFAVALGLVGFLLFAVVVIIQSLRGKNATTALSGLGLCTLLVLAGGFLFSITDGGTPPVEKKPASAQMPVPTTNNQTTEKPVDTAQPAENEAATNPEQEPVQPDTLNPTENTPPAPDSNAGGQLGDYYVEIKDAYTAKDYYGNNAIVITYSWTNNSAETIRADLAISEKAFQDGIQMDIAMIGDSDVYDHMSSTKEIRPGTTMDIQCAFVMKSESTVEVELSELFSLTDDVVTRNFEPKNLS